MSEHPDDFWISVSVVGDSWEVEINTTTLPNASEQRTWRYRSAMFGNLRTDWAYGKPPTGAHSK
jgi:hypothetical protein